MTIKENIMEHIVVDECPDAYGKWTLRFDNGTPSGDTERQPVGTIYSETHAEAIVRAVNNHERLIKALKMAIPFIGMGEEELCKREGDAHEAKANATAAIAAAEGREV